MTDNQKVISILQEIDSIFDFVHRIKKDESFDLSDEYRKLNLTYYNIFCAHLESAFILINSGHFSSAILLMRTILELFVKSFYLQFIEKEEGTSISDFLSNTKDFPSFFKMLDTLEGYKNVNGDGFGGSFIQFSKSELASYEKFSLFSHGKGEYLRASYDNQKLSYTTEQICEVLLTAKGLFEMLSLLLFLVQDDQASLGILLEKLKGRH